MSAFGLKIDPVIYHVIAVGVVNLFECDHLESASLGLRKSEVNFFRVVFRRLNLLHALDLLELALRLGRLGGLCAKAIGKLLQPRNFALLVLIGREQLHFLGFALHQIFVIIAAVTDQSVLANFHDAADELIEEFTIVRNHDNRSRIALQVFLEPEQRFQIEMVRRFIQHEQVRLLHQQASQMRAHYPATAQFTG